MPMSFANRKNETMFQLALYILQLEARKGHLRWKVTDLVRKAKVSRVLVYRYFGNTKEKMLASALTIFTEEFYGFSTASKALSLADRVAKSRSYAAENIESVLFYQQWRAKDNWLGQEFRKIEARFQRSLKKIFPGCTETELLLAHVCIHGLVTAPFLDPRQTRELCLILQKKSVLP